MRYLRQKKYHHDVEEIVGSEWATDEDLREVPLGRSPFFFVGALLALLIGTFGIRLGYLNIFDGNFYRALAVSNMSQTTEEEAPRGSIYDRTGTVLAENAPTFKAILKIGAFLKGDSASQEATLRTIENSLGIAPEMVLTLIGTSNADENPAPLILSDRVTVAQAIAIEGSGDASLTVEQGFLREYHNSSVFSSVVGYTGFAGPLDIAANPQLTYRDLVGKAGIESSYDAGLQGTPGLVVEDQDAHGHTLGSHEARAPKMGESIHLTIDSVFQTYFYNRLAQGLATLGRDVGVGIAMDPQNGEILSLVQIPSYDANALSSPGHPDEKTAILTSSLSPLFNRAVGGQYSPGSTIKPLVGIAALADQVITPEKELFSPGYLDVPNPYDPTKPTRYLDWRYQGYINMASAIAKSSDVYFYAVGGGAFDVKGLGIERLRKWWQTFGLGKPTGVDLPGEKSGFLPSPEWKQKSTGRPWLLGDTYNVSIGQGDLLLTPLQILDFTAAIGTDGKMYAPVLNLNAKHPTTTEDFSNLIQEIRVIQQGMKQTVTNPEGTAYTLHDLPFTVAAKTGSAQVLNNTQENAFFVGYAPADHPQIAILILIEHSKEGSLNAVPIAKDVLNWYYQNRMKGK